MKIVAYVNDNEIIITSRKNEQNFLKEYFGEGSGRSLEGYDRSQFKNDDTLVLSFSSILKMDYSRAPAKGQ
jgi:hypothetical protein